MKKTLTILAAVALVFTACKKEETAEAPPAEAAVTDTTAVVADTTAAPVAAPAQQTVSVNGGSVMTANPQANAQSYNAVPTGTIKTTPVTTAKGMNPPHGQPGHRCDISVGAPLNSAPGKKAQNGSATVTQATQVTPEMLKQASGSLPPTVAAPAEQVVTAPGMNPPHGQAGHDCSVAVGQPLPKKQ